MSVLADVRGQLRRRKGKRKGLSLARREARWGLIFISPWLFGFFAFYFLPMMASLIFSTLDFQLTAPGEAQFVGLANWRRMLFEDPNTWTSLGVTFKFALISLPIGMVSAFMLALLLNSKHLMGQNLFRTLFYAPTMVPAIAATIIWANVLNTHSGWVNRIIETLTGYPATGVQGIRWLDDPSLIYFTYTLIGIWTIGNMILINLAGLQSVPTDLYEAAEIDGAGWWRRLWHVTVPMVSPVIFYNLVLSLVGLMQYFLVPYVLNGGNGYPEDTTLFYMIYLYKQAFTFTNMGYGSALAWFLFVIALLITLALFGSGRYWVYYSAEQN